MNKNNNNSRSILLYILPYALALSVLFGLTYYFNNQIVFDNQFIINLIGIAIFAVAPLFFIFYKRNK